MTSGVSGKTASWVAAIVSVLILVGGGATAYSDLNTGLTKVNGLAERNREDIQELDRYDVHLTESVDTLKGNSIRTQTEMSNLQRTTEKLDFTMGELLKEMKRMNDNLIRMGAKDGKVK